MIELFDVSLTKISEDILCSKYHKGAILTEKKARDIDSVQLNMTRGQDFFIIADFSEGEINVEKDAERFFLKNGKMIPFTMGVAIISKGSRIKSLSRMISWNRAFYPIREVQTIEEAKSWFDKLRN